MLFALRAIGRIKSRALAQVNAGELDRVLSFAGACAAFTCSRAGTDPPRHSDVGPALSRLSMDQNKSRVPRSSLLISVKGRFWRKAAIHMQTGSRGR